MDISVYYNFQAKARGLNSVGDVIKVVNANRILYDSLVLPWLPTNKDSFILEVACGPGVFLHYLKDRGYKNSIGCDFSSVQIDLARQGGLSVILKDALEFLRSCESNSFDCVIGLDFYEHLPKEILLDFFMRLSV